MNIINKTVIDQTANQISYEIEVSNASSNGYSERFKIAATKVMDSYHITDIYCYNENAKEYALVSNLISPSTFEQLLEQ